MMLLSSFFQSANIQPEIYYKFLEDLREDAFIGGVDKVCREVKELYPNTNLVALIREKSDEYYLEKIKKKTVLEDKKMLTQNEPDYEAIEKAKTEWNILKQKLAREKGL